MENKEKEIRQLTVEFKAEERDGKKVIEGRAIPFNTFSPVRMGFREQILPEAVEGVIEKSDIKFLYNHNEEKGFLARNNCGKGKLTIDVREDGVYFSFPAKKDNLSQYVYERLESGELNEMSFAFTLDTDEWHKAEDGIYERTIKKFERLYDFSVVDSSFYGITDAVHCQRFDEIKQEEADKIAEEKRQADEEAERQKAEELKKYYDEMKAEYGKYL